MYNILRCIEMDTPTRVTRYDTPKHGKF